MKKNTFGKFLFAAAIGAAIVVAAKAIANAKAEEETMTVSSKKWDKTESISEWATKTDEGWTVPDGAYEVTSERRQKTSNVAEVARTINVATAGIDTGMRITMPNQVTYEPWYTYKIDKWVCAEDVKSSGTTDSADAYKDSTGVRFDPDKKIEYGDRKVFSRKVKFALTGICDQTGEEVTVEVGPSVYDLAKNGRTKIAFKRSLFGRKPKGARIMNVLETMGGVDTNDEVDSTEE